MTRDHSADRFRRLGVAVAVMALVAACGGGGSTSSPGGGSPGTGGSPTTGASPDTGSPGTSASPGGGDAGDYPNTNVTFIVPFSSFIEPIRAFVIPR